MATDIPASPAIGTGGTTRRSTTSQPFGSASASAGPIADSDSEEPSRATKSFRNRSALGTAVPSVGRIRRTGTVSRRTRASDTLPSQSRLTAPRPWVASTTSPKALSSA